jgi:hypothetical protein
MKSKQALFLSLPAPCEQSWHDMQPVSGGRHCNSCSKTIIDFSVLTDAEIFAAISNSKGTVCGRFANDQLHRPITAPVPPRHPFMPAMLITAGLAVGIATAGHAETRGSEQIEMNVEPAPLADTIVGRSPRSLPEVVVLGYEIKRRPYATSTGVVCVINTAIVPFEKPLKAEPAPCQDESAPKKEKRKKRFLFF